VRQFHIVSRSAAALVLVPDVEASVASNELDLAEVFRKDYRFVWRIVVCMGVPPPGVDDAVQEVFMVAHRRRADYDARACVRSWLFGIARNVARNHVRRARKDRARLPEVASSRPRDVPEEHMARVEAVELVERFLAGLDTRQRDVFVLAHIQGMTAPEIAAMLGVKLNTVYSRLRLARRRFERAIARHHARQQRRSNGRGA
jgi:RNA polymerase sigma-70 factor (ECF subfamily)